MRSIRYVLSGTPHNKDDCIDLSMKNNPNKVSLTLKNEERITEEYILRQFIGEFKWEFADRTVEYDEIFGGCFAHESQDRQRRSINNANQRLEHSICRIEQLGILIEGNENRIDFSLIYPQRKTLKQVLGL